MKRIKKSSIRRLMSLYLFFTVLLGASFLAMPFSVQAQSNIPVIIVGSAFWAGLLFGLVFLVLMLLKYKRWHKQEHGDEIPKRKIPGVLRFFKNMYASIADGVFLASVISFIALMFTKYNNAYVIYVLLFLMIVSFGLHGVLNGNIYNEIKRKNKRGEKT